MSVGPLRACRDCSFSRWPISVKDGACAACVILDGYRLFCYLIGREPPELTFLGKENGSEKCVPTTWNPASLICY